MPDTRIKLRIDGEPIPQPRPRAVGGGRFARLVSNPRKHPVNAFKQQVRLVASLTYHGEPLLGPVKIDVTFVMPRPKAMVWVRKPMNRAWCGVLPDFDNLVKSLLDPLKGIIWKDDGQVAVAHIVKVIAAGNEEPHTIIEVSQLEDWN